MIRIKRVYDPSTRADGRRLLVDRVWPRGLSKRKANLADWRKDLAPSTALRQWFGHDPAKWSEFRKRYRAELRRSDLRDTLNSLARLVKRRTVTLVYGAADEEHNQAIVLKEVIERLSR